MLIPYHLLLIMRNIEGVDLAYREYIRIARYLTEQDYDSIPGYDVARARLSEFFMDKENVALFPTLRDDVNIPIIPTMPKWSTPDPKENEQKEPEWLDNRLDQPILLPETGKDTPIQCKMEGISVQTAGSRPDWRPNINQWGEYVAQKPDTTEASLTRGTLTNVPFYYNQASGDDSPDGMISPETKIGVIHCSLGCTYTCKYRLRSTSNVLYDRVPSSLLIDSSSPTD